MQKAECKKNNNSLDNTTVRVTFSTADIIFRPPQQISSVIVFHSISTTSCHAQMNKVFDKTTPGCHTNCHIFSHYMLKKCHAYNNNNNQNNQSYQKNTQAIFLKITTKRRHCCLKLCANIDMPTSKDTPHTTDSTMYLFTSTHYNDASDIYLSLIYSLVSSNLYLVPHSMQSTLQILIHNKELYKLLQWHYLQHQCRSGCDTKHNHSHVLKSSNHCSLCMHWIIMCRFYLLCF